MLNLYNFSAQSYTTKIQQLHCTSPTLHCTEVCFASFLSGGFTTVAVINPPKRKLAKRTSVCTVTLPELNSFKNNCPCCSMYSFIRKLMRVSIDYRLWVHNMYWKKTSRPLIVNIITQYPPSNSFTPPGKLYM